MKKLLTILAALGLTATTGTTVVACSHQNDGNRPINVQTTTVDFSLTIPTKKGDLLTEKDQQGLHDEIINQLKTANSKANVNDQTFEVDLSHLTPEFTSIEVKVNQTSAANGKPGINAGTIDVELKLTNPELTSIPPSGCDVYLHLTETIKDIPLTKNDQEALQTKVLQELADVNQEAANVRTSTFSIATDLSKVTSATPKLEIKVNKTKSDGHFPGLRSGNVDVQLSLEPQLKTPIPAQGTNVSFTLTKTHRNDPLDKADIDLLQPKIIKALNDVNKDRAVVEPDTFTFNSWDDVTSETKEISVNVKATDSTIEKPGLIKGEVKVTLELSPVLWDIVEKLDGQTNLGYVPNDETATTKANEIIKAIPQLNGHVILGEAKDGKITVDPGDDTVQGHAEFTYQIQEKIADLVKGQTELGYVDNDADALELTQDVIKKLDLQGHIVLGEAAGGKITVDPGDDTVQGHAEFTYQVSNKINQIIDSKHLDLGYVLNDDEALDKLKKVIDEVKLTEKVQWTFDQINKTFTVVAIDKTLTGKVEFKYQLKINIMESLFSQLNLGTVQNDAEAKSKAEAVVEKVGLTGKVKLDEPSNHLIHVTATDESLTGEADFTYQI